MEIQQREMGTVVCLDVQGRLVEALEDGRLMDRVNSLLLQGRRRILLNFKEVTQIDTSGLAVITAVRRASERNGATIRLVNLPPRIYDLLVITRLITLFEVFESEADAVNSFTEQCA